MLLSSEPNIRTVANRTSLPALCFTTHFLQSLQPRRSRTIHRLLRGREPRRHYGDFEGTIPKREYGAGTVMLWDRGFWMPADEMATIDMALRKGELKFTLAGDKLRGGWVLVRMKGHEHRGRRTNWLLIKHRDEFACEGADELLAEDRSVASGRTMEQIAAGKGRGAKPFMAARRDRKRDR
jgi:bifunctional non-homologous end joining protein LigD